VDDTSSCYYSSKFSSQLVRSSAEQCSLPRRPDHKERPGPLEVKPGLGPLPLLERANRNLLPQQRSRSRRGVATQIRCELRTQEAIRCGCAHGEQLGSTLLGELEMLIPQQALLSRWGERGSAVWRRSDSRHGHHFALVLSLMFSRTLYQKTTPTSLPQLRCFPHSGACELMRAQWFS